MKTPNVEVTGAARLYRAASSDRRERGRLPGWASLLRPRLPQTTGVIEKVPKSPWPEGKHSIDFLVCEFGFVAKRIGHIFRPPNKAV